MSEEDKALELLFQRPLEPIFTTRDNGNAAFDVPDSFYTDRYSGANINLESRYGDKVDVKIPLRELPKLPNLALAQSLGRKSQFSLFQDKHKEIAGDLIKQFMDAPDKQNFTALCAYTKDRVNPVLFQYCYSVAVQHRRDTRSVNVPAITETFPANFVEPSVFKDARAEGSLISSSGDRIYLNIPQNYTASDREDEQRMAYFREDLGVNSHHWHWHLVYPTEGPREIVAKDRRGELFYYMHHQIIARYNVERFCNNLARVKPLNNLREPIPEGYFPKILSSTNNRTYPARITNQTLRDVNRESNIIEITDCDRWRDRILGAIDRGFLEDSQNKQHPLNNDKGIDLLGDLLEASSLSLNRQFYGNLHNMGHNLISFIHDPDSRHLEEFGVMGDVTTAMRDPIFYRWHLFIDNIFNKHKALLPRYEANDLGFQGVKVDSIEAKVNSRNARPNNLLTYLQKSEVDLAAGLDFGPNGNLFASFVHLQHAPFEYTINATNRSAVPTKGTCRLFLLPKVDERGTPLTLDELRLLAVELDKFAVDLVPGPNIIRRRSDESSVTIPYERSFRAVGAKYQPKDPNALAQFQFCGCGWPQHMLLPKGKAEGMMFTLFAMISDYTNDHVEQTNVSRACGDAYSFCGLRDQLYPDKRTMGFPFDRRLTGDNLEELISSYPNMIQTNLKIIFNDQIVDKTKTAM